jgi:hypothetical protein
MSSILYGFQDSIYFMIIISPSRVHLYEAGVKVNVRIVETGEGVGTHQKYMYIYDTIVNAFDPAMVDHVSS